MRTKLQVLIANAIARVGVRETSRLLETDDETTLRLALPGAIVRRGSIALAEQNAHRLVGADEARTG